MREGRAKGANGGLVLQNDGTRRPHASNWVTNSSREQGPTERRKGKKFSGP